MITVFVFVLVRVRTCCFITRDAYRSYKRTYAALLSDPGNASLKAELEAQEEELDITNITVARGQAKYEVSARLFVTSGHVLECFEY